MSITLINLLVVWFFLSILARIAEFHKFWQEEVDSVVRIKAITSIIGGSLGWTIIGWIPALRQDEEDGTSFFQWLFASIVIWIIFVIALLTYFMCTFVSIDNFEEMILDYTNEKD